MLLRLRPDAGYAGRRTKWDRLLSWVRSSTGRMVSRLTGHTVGKLTQGSTHLHQMRLVMACACGTARFAGSPSLSVAHRNSTADQNVVSLIEDMLSLIVTAPPIRSTSEPTGVWTAQEDQSYSSMREHQIPRSPSRQTQESRNS
jgi:hypothetical protein